MAMAVALREQHQPTVRIPQTPEMRLATLEAELDDLYKVGEYLLMGIAFGLLLIWLVRR